MIPLIKIFKESTNSFDGQETGEKVFLLVRRHPFYILMKFLFSFIAIVIPLYIASLYAPYLITRNLASLTLFVLSIWIMLIWLLFFYHFTMYTLDVWIITDRRIIDSTQHGFFNRTTSELHINRVQDISVNINGVLQTALHFGDVQVQTAGTEERFKFIQVPNPEKIKNEIMHIASIRGQDTHV